jgi:hypothetical protein
MKHGQESEGNVEMHKTPVYNADGWTLYSFGNGWAYNVVNKALGIDVWFQDEDALIFEDYSFDGDNGFSPKRFIDCYSLNSTQAETV